MVSTQQLPAVKSALVVSHPGHELRAYGWLEKARPLVFVLTDGSGRADRSRLDSTAALLRQVGAQPAPIFGRFTDREFYNRVLAGDVKKFIALTDELAAALIAEKIGLVCGDAIEGYSPSHDLCRYIINTAIELAQKKSGRTILNYDFLLVGPPGSCPPELDGRAVVSRLADEVYERKLKAGLSYPELEAEVKAALTALGKDAFRTECFRPVDPQQCLAQLDGPPPEYETYGEKRIAAGHYRELIRRREHIKPLVEALWRHAARSGP